MTDKLAALRERLAAAVEVQSRDPYQGGALLEAVAEAAIDALAASMGAGALTGKAALDELARIDQLLSECRDFLSVTIGGNASKRKELAERITAALASVEPPHATRAVAGIAEHMGYVTPTAPPHDALDGLGKVTNAVAALKALEGVPLEFGIHAHIRQAVRSLSEAIAAMQQDDTKERK